MTACYKYIMEIASILLGLALFIVVGLFVAKPFLTESAPKRPLSPRQQLLARKETLMNDLRELDFDHDTNKIPDDVYAFQREALVKETAVVLKQLDSPKDMQAVDDDIEAAIARAKSGKADDGKETAVSGKKTFCSNCGKPLDSNDKFCTKCGHKQ